MSKFNNPHYKSIAVRVKQYRESLDENQGDFGKHFGLDQTAISSIERGKNDITLKTLYMLIDKGVNPTWLLLGQGPMLLAHLNPKEATLEVRTTDQGKEYIIRTA